MSVLLKAIETPGSNLYDEVFCEYIRLLRASPDYKAFAKDLVARREVLEDNRTISTLRSPLGMSKEAGSMRHQASIPAEAWNAHERLWPGLQNKERAELLRRHLPECFF